MTASHKRGVNRSLDNFFQGFLNQKFHNPIAWIVIVSNTSANLNLPSLLPQDRDEFRSGENI
jgi:hypothetical protein